MGNALRKVPDYADLMDIKQFREYVRAGGIMDDDGAGYYSDGEYMYDIVNFDTLRYHRKYKYVAWFNK